MSKLVICEKPSVAQSVGKVLGASKRCDGYLEGGGYLVSWCVGHLVELAQPEAYGETYAKWRLEDLPILPEKWRYQVSPSTKKQFHILKELMSREDVASIVEATDAGREGELIFRLVYHQCKCKKPFERLWISSMEDAAIREGFARLRPGTEYDALYEAALCRERADWIVGINATRLFSCKYGPTLNARLSREDADRMESNSIQSQRAICLAYIESHDDLELVDTYIDDGETGSNTDRPGFQRMLQDMRSGRIDCAVSKDLSRFSRNYIDAGNYLEKIFPAMGIRYIAINDNYDSMAPGSGSDVITLPFKNLVNDIYCRDISIKIRTSLDRCPRCPYPYRLNRRF